MRYFFFIIAFLLTTLRTCNRQRFEEIESNDGFPRPNLAAEDASMEESEDNSMEDSEDDSVEDPEYDPTEDPEDDSMGDPEDDSIGDPEDDSMGDLGDDSTGDLEDDSTGDLGDDSMGDLEDDSTGESENENYFSNFSCGFTRKQLNELGFLDGADPYVRRNNLTRPFVFHNFLINISEGTDY